MTATLTDPCTAAADLLDGDDLTFPTPGDLAAYLDARTLNTEALVLLDEHLLDVYDHRIDRLIWTMPPQEGKSMRVSRAFPLWLLLHRPDTRIAIVSYDADIARRWGRMVRNDIKANPELGLTVRHDTAAAHEWQLDGHDGGIITAGIGGAITGRPVDVLIIDDPLKGRKEAESRVFRDAVWDWWTDSGSTRLAPGAPVIVLLTRWHEDDLAGRLLASESAAEWTHVNIPALADHDPAKGEADPLGRHPGQWLRSARRRTDTMWARIRRQVGSRAFNALYQGKPAPIEGGIFKRSWWQYSPVPRAVQRPDGSWWAIGATEVLQSWDCAFEDADTSDYVVGQIWARRGPKAWLLDEIRDHLDMPATCDAMASFSAKWPQARRKLVEKKANGHAVIQTMRKSTPGIVAVTPTESKLSRATAVSPFIEAGDVSLPRPADAPWIAEFVDECANFPNGSHDDRVDTMSQALARFFLESSDGGDLMEELVAERTADAVSDRLPFG